MSANKKKGEEYKMVLSEGLCELDNYEMEYVDGGSKAAAQAVLIAGGAVLLGVGAPVVGVAAGAGAFATAYVSGVGLMGSALFV